MSCLVGFQGVKGSYSEQAVNNYFREMDIKEYCVDRFKDIFELLEKGIIEYGVLPIENSSTGAISEVYDLLKEHNCYIVGETFVKVKHNLLALKGAKLEDIKEVYSHPQGFEQSKAFLSNFEKWKLIPYYNTAMSAKLISEEKDKSKAAIASQRAANIYDLQILQEEINCMGVNTTRFIIVSSKNICNYECDKVSIILSTKHRAGALFNVLKNLAENNINMLKIESRPIPDKPWEYFFYIDFEGNLLDNNIIDALELIKKDSSYFKLLGNFKKGSVG